MRLIILQTVFLLASCTYPDMKGVYKEVNHRDSYRFSEKYGDYLFYRFYGHTKSLRQYEGTYFQRFFVNKLNNLLFCSLLFFPFSADTEFKRQEMELCIINEALEMYRSDVGSYPDVTVGPILFLYNRNNMKGWNGPYLNPYVSRVTDSSNLDRCKKKLRYIQLEDKYVVYSLGENSKDNNMKSDDIFSKNKFVKV